MCVQAWAALSGCSRPASKEFDDTTVEVVENEDDPALKLLVDTIFPQARVVSFLS